MRELKGGSHAQVSLVMRASLLLAAAAAHQAAALTCGFGPPACYADAPARPVPYLVAPVPGGAGSHTLVLGPGEGSCAYLCAASGFGVMAATGYVNASGGRAAYCYCGVSIDPKAVPAPSASCDVPCPGNASQACGGRGFSSVYGLDCDGPLPPAPVGPALAPGRQCSQPEAAAWGFCNTSWPLEARVADLTARIALVEMGPLLTARSSSPIPRLGLTAFYWGTNALHGVLGAACRPSGACPTVWPDVVAMATSWNATAWRAMGATTGREMRALDNVLWSGQGANPGGGLTAWGPTINVIRDPRWGRVQESCSEDPYLCGVLGAAVADGLQRGEDLRYLQAVATLKHLVAYSLEDYSPPGAPHEWMRQTFDARVSAFDLADTYTPAFRRAIVQGGAAGVMYAANSVNGVPACGDAALDALLHSWGFDGYRATDGGQIDNMVVGHKFVPTLEQAITYAAAAESDIADGDDYKDGLVSAFMGGNVTLDAARRLVANTLRVRFRLGTFDPPAGQPYLAYGEADIGTAAARAAVGLAARQGLVLLQNNASGGRGLPLTPGARWARAGALVVVGPRANDTGVLVGNYAGPFCAPGPHGPVTDCEPSIFTALQRAFAPGAVWAPGTVDAVTGDPALQAAAVAAASTADAVVLVLGLDQSLEREQLDRYNLTLPPAQSALYAAVSAAAASTGAALAVVLVHGGAIAVPEVKASAPAILDAFYPGPQGGSAVADALFGAYNPGGKLASTVYDAPYQFLYNFTNMSVAAPQLVPGGGGALTPGGRTYRYYTGVPLWPFGWGLSYTRFALGWGSGGPPAGGAPTVTLTPQAPVLNLSVAVSNMGAVAGDEVVQLYFAPVAGTFDPPSDAPPYLPTRQLVGFQRVGVPAGGAPAQLVLALDADELALCSADGTRAVRNARYRVTLERGFGAELGVDVLLEGWPGSAGARARAQL